MLKLTLFAISFFLVQIVIAYQGADSSGTTIPTVEKMLADIRQQAGIQTYFKLKKENVLNLQASGKRTIAYNPDFIAWLNNLTQDKWSVMALLAHEVGHHEKGHIRHRKQKREKELEADEFAGYILFKLGASLNEAEKVMKYIASTTTSLTHPARAARQQAIQKGWMKAAIEATVDYIVK